MANEQLNATLKLYNVPFTQEDNFILDEPLTYLNSLTPVATVEDFQFSYPEMKKTIKVRIDGLNVTALYARPNFNYALVESVSQLSGATQTNRALYFVDDVQWVDSDTVRISLSYDTLNGFVLFVPQRKSANIPWEDHTHINRQHKDRFKKLGTTGKYVPVIDYMSEGITVSKIKISDTEITDNYGKWYVIYKSQNALSEGGANPVNVYLATEKNFTISRASAEVSLTATDFTKGEYYFFVADEYSTGGQLGANSGAYNRTLGVSNLVAIIVYVTDAGYLRVTSVTGNTNRYDTSTTLTVSNTPNDYATVYLKGMRNAYVFEDNTARLWYLFKTTYIDVYYVGGTSAKITTINDVVRSSPKLLKIVELPYLPFDMTIENNVIAIPQGMSYIGGYIKLDLNQVHDDRQIKSIALSRIESVANNAASGQVPMLSYHEEPKLLHSDFTTIKFVFDSFSYDVGLERLTLLSSTQTGFDNSRTFNIYLYPSLNVSSSFLFYIENNYLTKVGDYDGYIAVKRNNEVALFNSEYLNYLRNGYNYDLKSRTLQENSQIIGTVISAVGMVASFASSVYTGGAGVAAGVALATSLAASSAGIAKTVSANEISMASRLASLQNQAVNVTGADDLDLLHYYSPNLKVEIYTPAVYEEKAIIHLLRLKGYSCDEKNIPNTHTRLYFNYVQCEAEFLWTTTRRINDTIVTDVKQRFSQGVTFLHAVNGSYDFERKYENWENALLN